MSKYIIELIAEEEKALLSDMLSIQEWLDGVIHNKARQCIDKIVLEHSDKQPKKIIEAEKLAIVRNAQVKTAQEVENERIEKLRIKP